MDIVHAVWLSSTFGAAMFFSAGLVFGSRRFRRAEDSQLALSQTRVELERSNAERQGLQGEVARLGSALASTKATLDQEQTRARTRGDELQAEVGRLRSQLEAASTRESEAAKHQEQLQLREGTLRQQHTELSQKLARSDAEVARLRSQLEVASRRAGDAAKQQEQQSDLKQKLAASEADAARLRSELEVTSTRRAEHEATIAKLESQRTEAAEVTRRMEAQLVTARRDARDAQAQVEALRLELARAARPAEPSGDVDLSTLQRRSAELSLKAQMLEQRALEFERQAAENHALKSQLETMHTLRSEKEALVRRVRDLEAQSFATVSVTNDKHAPMAPTKESGLEGIQRILDTLVRETEGCKVVALSDVRGLVIAGAGDREHQDELAAAASVTTYAVDRIRDLLPMSHPMSFEWIDDNRVAHRTHWLRSNDDAFLLTTLRLSAASSAPEVDRVGPVLARLLTPGAEGE